jgi:hypothetical protein
VQKVYVHYWTALDFDTDKVVWEKMAGTGYRNRAERSAVQRRIRRDRPDEGHALTRYFEIASAASAGWPEYAAMRVPFGRRTGRWR